MLLFNDALGGLVFSVLATGHSMAGSNPTQDGGFFPSEGK
jgi:hypothetical protein